MKNKKNNDIMRQINRGETMIELDKEYNGKLKDKNFIDLFCGLGGFRLALDTLMEQNACIAQI